MYKPLFNKRRVLVFHQFGNKGWSLFSCLGHEVVCSVLSVSTLTYASAESISTEPVTADTVAVTSARERMLDEVSVTGSRAPLTKSQAARMVTVLERADIQQAPVQSINDLLKYAVGVDVRQRSPIGAQTDISIRGGTPEQIIILLNGINICDPQTGHNTMDLPIDLSDILRIEVLEGPAGRIYGTSSLVGAINIVTSNRGMWMVDSGKNSGKWRVESGENGGEWRVDSGERIVQARMEGGSYGYAHLGFSYSPSTIHHPLSTKEPSTIHHPLSTKEPSTKNPSTIHHPLSTKISASYTRSDGYSRSKAGGLNSDYSGAKAFYQGAYTADGIRANWHVGIADKGWGSSTAYASPKWQADDQYEHTTKLTAALQATIQWGAVSLHPSLYWNQHQDRYEGYRGQPDKMAYNYNRTDVTGLQLSSYFDWSLGRTALGAELRNENLLSSNLGEPLSHPHHINGTDRDYTLGLNRTNISAFVEHNVLLNNLTISAGMVAVKNTWADMNLTVYPGIDANLRIGRHWRLHASYNTSLRMPSFTEMYYRLQGYAANPHLKPEEMHAVEFGTTIHFQPSTLHHPLSTINLTLWHHQGRNMIDWIMDTSQGDAATWQSVNHTRLNSIGIEASATIQIPRSTIQLSYSYIDQEKELEPGIVSQYALEYLRHKLVIGLQLPIVGNLVLNANLRWQDRVGQYTDFDGTVCDYKPYALVDARLSWCKPAYELYVKADNLLNTTYRDHGLVPQPGRWLIGGFSLHL